MWRIRPQPTSRPFSAPSLTNLAHQLLIGGASLSTTHFAIAVMVLASITDAEDHRSHGGAPVPSSPPAAAINVVAPPYIYVLTCNFVKWQLKKKAENLRVLLKRRYFKPLVPSSSSSASVDDSSSSEEYWRRWSVARIIYGFTYILVELCVGVRTYVLS